MKASELLISEELSLPVHHYSPIPIFSPSCGLMLTNQEKNCQYHYHVEPTQASRHDPIEYQIFKIKLDSQRETTKAVNGEKSPTTYAIKEKLLINRSESMNRGLIKQVSIRMEANEGDVMIEITETHQGRHQGTYIFVLFITLSTKPLTIVQSQKLQLMISPSQYLITHLGAIKMLANPPPSLSHYMLSKNILTYLLPQDSCDIDLMLAKNESQLEGIRRAEFVDAWGIGKQRLLLMGARGQIYLMEKGAITKAGANTNKHNEQYYRMHIIIEDSSEYLPKEENNSKIILIVKVGFNKLNLDLVPFFKLYKLNLQNLDEIEILEIQGGAITGYHSNTTGMNKKLKSAPIFGILGDRLYYRQLYFHDNRKFYKVDLSQLILHPNEPHKKHHGQSKYSVSHLFTIENNHSLLALTFSNQSITLIRRNNTSTHYAFEQFQLYSMCAAHQIQQINRRFQKFSIKIQEKIIEQMRNMSSQKGDEDSQMAIDLSFKNISKLEEQVDKHITDLNKGINKRISELKNTAQEISNHRQSLNQMHQLRGILQERIQQVRSNNDRINSLLTNQTKQTKILEEEKNAETSIAYAVECLHRTLEELKDKKLSISHQEEQKLRYRIRQIWNRVIKLRERVKMI